MEHKSLLKLFRERERVLRNEDNRTQKHQEEVQKWRDEEERKSNQKRKQEHNAKFDKESFGKVELEKLLEKKSNWQQFQQVLQQNEITMLYHFTDEKNICSIKKIRRIVFLALLC